MSSHRSTKFVTRRLSSKLGESILPQLNEVVNYQLQSNPDDIEQDVQNIESEQFTNFEQQQSGVPSRVKTPHEFLPETNQSNQV